MAHTCLADFRTVLATGTETDGGTAKASAAFDCVNAAVADVDGNGQIGRIAQEMDALTTGLVVPVTIKTDAQKEAVGNILASLKERAAAIAHDARGAVDTAAVPVIALARMSPMQVVVTHWDAIVPAWLSALFLDMSPVVLLAFRSIIVASTRALPDGNQHRYTVADIVELARLAQVLNEATSVKAHDEAKPATIDGTVRSAGRIVYHSGDDEPGYAVEDLDIREEDDPDAPKDGGR